MTIKNIDKDVLKFQIKIHITGKCDLRCNFCPNSDEMQKNYTNSSYDKVKEHIDYALKLGYVNIELGVLVGDILNYNIIDFEKVIKYLYDNDQVNAISIVTSLYNLTDKHIKVLNKYSKKIVFLISLYGENTEQYKKTTSVDGFNIVYKNIEKISKIDFKLVLIQQMYRGNRFSSIVNIKIEKQGIYNWPPKKSIKKKSGVCQYLYWDMAILYDGKISSCGWIDINNDLIIGTVKDSTKYIIEKMKSRIMSHKLGLYPSLCKNCDFFDEVGDSYVFEG